MLMGTVCREVKCLRTVQEASERMAIMKSKVSEFPQRAPLFDIFCDSMLCNIGQEYQHLYGIRTPIKCLLLVQ